jgi:hypothetical protein
MHNRFVAVIVGVAIVGTAARASADVTVFLDRDGQITDDGVTIPRFGGGDRVWNAVVACVRTQYAPFAVDIVDEQPSSGSYITAVVGGRASLLGLDDRSTNGVGPYSGELIPDAVVHVFSQLGTGERDVENLCAVTAHEVGHALGLDHEVYCGDVMSYYLDQCGARTFIDVDAPCGEHGERTCGNGERSQNSYQRLAEMVGLRAGDDRRPPNPAPDRARGPAPNTGDDPWATPEPQDPYAADQADVDRAPPVCSHRPDRPDRVDRGRRHAHHRVRVYWVYR